jgi:hypothetical protein
MVAVIRQCTNSSYVFLECQWTFCVNAEGEDMAMVRDEIVNDLDYDWKSVGHIFVWNSWAYILQAWYRGKQVGDDNTPAGIEGFRLEG